MQGEGYPEAFATICRNVRERGWQRVILLGEDLREGPYSLKACLAQSSVMVLSPGAGDREWLRDVAAGRCSDEATIVRFSALLSDGMEHGVQALLVTDAFLAELVQSIELGVPVLTAGEACA